jgi:hypothetical protein
MKRSGVVSNRTARADHTACRDGMAWRHRPGRARLCGSFRMRTIGWLGICATHVVALFGSRRAGLREG